ncbi:MAG: 16S rRNA (cytosine(1402)-N(4))-methyltransferase, partial [Jiangellaceae bacterium]
MTEQSSARAAHVPVMLERVVDLLAPSLDQPGAVVVDATLGMGGHAEALLRRCPNARLVGLDRDTE